MSKLILFHKNCADGFVASFYARKKFPEATFQAVGYGEEPPSVEGREVYILDFCYDRSRLLELSSKALSLKVLDHHISAMEKCSDLDFCLFDLEKSGASLSYSFFCDFSNQRRPLLVDLIEFRDLGFYYQNQNLIKTFLCRYNQPLLKEVIESDLDLCSLYSYLDSFNFNYEEFELLENKLESREGLEEALLIGRKLFDYKNLLIETILKTKTTFTLKSGLSFALVNSSLFQSDLGNLLASEADVGVVWYESDRGYKFSLRSKNQDVRKIAEIFGGGGHRCAAGFNANDKNILQELDNSSLTWE